MRLGSWRIIVCDSALVRSLDEAQGRCFLEIKTKNKKFVMRASGWVARMGEGQREDGIDCVA